MSPRIKRKKRKAPLLMRPPHDPRPRPGQVLRLRMRRHHERLPLLSLTLKTLLPTPRHILDRQQRPVSKQDKVEPCVAEHGPFAAFNDAG